MASAPSIQIALATCNSARFLGELLDSLFAQTVQGFTIMVSDDGSEDGTPAIVADYRQRHPGRIEIVDGDPPGGAMENFSRLMGCASADYLMFCDHDDVWLPDKVALTLLRMQALEARHGPEAPLLVHTELIVVGPDLAVRAAAAARRRPPTTALNDLGALLVANHVVGCTTMANRALYRRARPVPATAIMHDFWLALVAASLGHIGHVETPTLLYRQHGRNLLGASRRGRLQTAVRALHIVFRDGWGPMLERLSAQAGALLARYGPEMSPGQQRAAATLAGLWSGNRWSRFRRLRRAGVRRPGLPHAVALCIAVTKHRARDAAPIAALRPPAPAAEGTKRG